MKELILVIFSAGVPGMLTFWLLSYFGIINYTKNDTFEKSASLAFFSAINAGVGLKIYDLISKNPKFCLYSEVGFPKLQNLGVEFSPYFNIGVCTLIAALCLSVIVYPILMKGFNLVFMWVGKKLKLPKKSSNSVLWEVLNKESDCNAYVYIFDFNDNFIESGVASRLSDRDEEFLFSLRGDTGYAGQKILLEEVLRWYNKKSNEILGAESNKKEPEIVLDFKNKLKFIIIF